ncbi:hypothetical protein AQZ52_17005 [Novosphingobium fuchskuhlense]|uniref:Uncharacterized protein n=1 Tax=Novosphingobium fuchskuhlense TaxID=1117702 RepID=A0A124JTT1_9SPHN|nr:hypothetical protein [Novosphingobium fuchskuhlense]KUR70503.1 hypothetical protein AQZ52_17005 [Novosphingobium fuchskuhlense]
MKRAFALLSAFAVLQLAIPAQAAPPTMIALCGGGAPIPLPMKNHDADKPCCKICHSAMRKRFGGGTCCGENDEEEDTGQ